MHRARFASALGLILFLAAALPARAASRTYTLTVTNKTCSPIAISLDKHFQEAIPAGTFHTIKGVKVGHHVVTVQGCSGSVDREIRVDGKMGNAYEEYACPHQAPQEKQDPYKVGAQPTGVPPAPVIVQYQPPEKVVEVRRERPLFEIRLGDSRHRHGPPRVRCPYCHRYDCRRHHR